MSKKTKGMITAFLILFSLLVIFLFSLFIDSWLAKTSFGKSFGLNLHRLSTLISMVLFALLLIFIHFIIYIVKSGRERKK